MSVSRFAFFEYHHLFCFVTVARNRVVNINFAVIDTAIDNGKVFFFCCTVFKLAVKVSFDERMLGEEDKTGSFIIDTVDSLSREAGIVLLEIGINTTLK